MLIYFVRHGQSFANLQEYWNQSWPKGIDAPLTELGKKQVSYLKSWIQQNWNGSPNDLSWRKGVNFDSIYSSPMKRAIETAVILRGTLCIDIYIEIDLHEFGGLTINGMTDPVYEVGMNEEKMKSKGANITLNHTLQGDGWWNGRVEDRVACHHRGDKIIEWLRKKLEEGEKRICIVGHNDGTSYVLYRLLGSLKVDFPFFNAGISAVDLNEDNCATLYHNFIAYPSEMATW